jgi:hypothetical protein
MPNQPNVSTSSQGGDASISAEKKPPRLLSAPYRQSAALGAAASSLYAVAPRSHVGCIYGLRMCTTGGGFGLLQQAISGRQAGAQAGNDESVIHALEQACTPAGQHAVMHEYLRCAVLAVLLEAAECAVARGPCTVPAAAAGRVQAPGTKCRARRCGGPH